MPDRQSGRIVEAGGGGGCKQQQVAPTMLDLRGFGAWRGRITTKR